MFCIATVFVIISRAIIIIAADTVVGRIITVVVVAVVIVVISSGHGACPSGPGRRCGASTLTVRRQRVSSRSRPVSCTEFLQEGILLQ